MLKQKHKAQRINKHKGTHINDSPWQDVFTIIDRCFSAACSQPLLSVAPSKFSFLACYRLNQCRSRLEESFNEADKWRSPFIELSKNRLDKYFCLKKTNEKFNIYRCLRHFCPVCFVCARASSSLYPRHLFTTLLFVVYLHTRLVIVTLRLQVWVWLTSYFSFWQILDCFPWCYYAVLCLVEKRYACNSKISTQFYLYYK